VHNAPQGDGLIIRKFLWLCMYTVCIMCCCCCCGLGGACSDSQLQWQSTGCVLPMLTIWLVLLLLLLYAVCCGVLSFQAAAVHKSHSCGQCMPPH
jgi:hypothetical protein